MSSMASMAMPLAWHDGHATGMAAMPLAWQGTRYDFFSMRLLVARKPLAKKPSEGARACDCPLSYSEDMKVCKCGLFSTLSGNHEAMHARWADIRTRPPVPCREQ